MDHYPYTNSPQELGPSNLTITLSTEAPGGSRLDGKGKIKIAGEAIFQDGDYQGLNCHLIIEGTLSPLP